MHSPASSLATTAAATTQPVRVAVVDDHPAVREGLRALLAAEPDIRPIATAATARHAELVAARLHPDVMVVDYHLPDEDGLALCLRLKELVRAPAVLIYSAFADERLAAAAAIAGADALISKGEDPDELVRLIHLVARGAAPPIRLAAPALQSAAALLDPEDLPVLGMLAHGTPPDEIAATLRIPESWLAPRRWAMLARLTRDATRRRLPRRDATVATPSG